MPDNLTVNEKLEKLNNAFKALQKKLADGDELPVSFDNSTERYIVSLYTVGKKADAEALANRIYDAVLNVETDELPKLAAAIKGTKKDFNISGYEMGGAYCLKLNFDNETARRVITLTDRGVEPLANLAVAGKGYILE